MIHRVQKYDFTLIYKPGKTMFLADTLSRAHTTGDNIEQADINVVTYLPMSEKRLSEIKEETAKENTLQRLKTTIIQGWPNERAEVAEELTPHWSHRDELSIHDSLIYKGQQVVIPLNSERK